MYAWMMSAIIRPLQDSCMYSICYIQHILCVCVCVCVCVFHAWVAAQVNRVNWYIRLECNRVTGVMPVS